MHNWRCCRSAVRCCALWYWQLRRKFNVTFLYFYSFLFSHIRNKGMTWQDSMKSDNVHLLPNHTSSHWRWPQAAHRTSSKLQGLINIMIFVWRDYIHKVPVILNDNHQSETHKPYDSPIPFKWLAVTTKADECWCLHLSSETHWSMSTSIHTQSWLV